MADKSFNPPTPPPAPFKGSGEPGPPRPPAYQPPMPAPKPFQGSGETSAAQRLKLDPQIMPPREFKDGEPTQTQGVVSLRQWKGMISNANPHLLGGENTATQTNMASTVLGQVQGRGGLRAVSWEN